MKDNDLRSAFEKVAERIARKFLSNGFKLSDEARMFHDLLADRHSVQDFTFLGLMVAYDSQEHLHGRGRMLYRAQRLWHALRKPQGKSSVNSGGRYTFVRLAGV